MRWPALPRFDVALASNRGPVFNGGFTGNVHHGYRFGHAPCTWSPEPTLRPGLTAITRGRQPVCPGRASFCAFHENWSIKTNGQDLLAQTRSGVRAPASYRLHGIHIIKSAALCRRSPLSYPFLTCASAAGTPEPKRLSRAHSNAARRWPVMLTATHAARAPHSTEIPPSKRKESASRSKRCRTRARVNIVPTDARIVASSNVTGLSSPYRRLTQ